MPIIFGGLWPESTTDQREKVYVPCDKSIFNLDYEYQNLFKDDNEFIPLYNENDDEHDFDERH